ncbi:MAG: FlgD immunoglobulin-like domain containing protein [bacterium]
MTLRALAICTLVFGAIVGFGSEAAAQPVAWSLAQNTPNPFCPELDGTTSIDYTVLQDAYVIIVVLSPDSTTVVKTLVGAVHAAGFFKVTWDGTDDANVPVAPGNYPYRMTAESSGEATIFFDDTKVATISCANANEAQSWGAIKALHAKP